MLLCNKSLSSTLVELALQSFYQAKSVSKLALDLTLVQLKNDIFLYQRLLFYTLNLCNE